MVALKLRKIGNSIGAVFPQEVLAKMHLAEGDTLYLSESPEGYRVTPYGPDFEAQMLVARRVMKKRRNALRVLTK